MSNYAHTSEWDSLSSSARETMEELGNFKPTLNVQDREIKGWTDEGAKTYWDAPYLLRLSKDFTEVAEWLELRAVNEALDKSNLPV